MIIIDDSVMSDIDEILQEEIQNDNFAKVWEETALEDQIKRINISTRIENETMQEQFEMI